METMRAAYRCAGLGWSIEWLARPVCDTLYHRFVRNRLRLGCLLGLRDDNNGDARCGDRCRV